MHCYCNFFSEQTNAMAAAREVESLREEVHELQQKLVQAAEFGKQLLDSNSDLTEQHDKQAKEHRLDLEVCGKYSD